MNKHSHNESDFEKILSSLDGLTPAEPRPFFYTRLQARMMKSEQSSIQRAMKLVAKPAFVLGTGILVLLLNGYILFSKLEQKQVQAEESTQMLASEYTSLNSHWNENLVENP
ncbi:hypothetical protein [Pollutibacter soli]|uniref:hypothetical protein n=1 Tax=Pollutibacter soli TaxID=3034157 RepID=UPI0030136852